MEAIRPLLPLQKTGRKGRPPKDHRLMLNGMLWIARSGYQWRELPEYYGKWQGAYTRFRKRRDEGALKQIFHTLSTNADMENLSIDSTSVKVHQSANGSKKGTNQKPQGALVVGLTPKFIQ